MIPTNKFKSYSAYEVRAFEKQSEEFLQIFKTANELLKNAKDGKKATKDKDDVSADNVIFLDPSIEIQFAKLKEEKMPLHEIFEIYGRWFNSLDMLVKGNTTRLHRPKMLAHVANILVVCSSVREVLEAAVN
jgi:hypothetical protein